MIVQLLLSLAWRSVLVLHEYEHDANFGCSLEATGISYVDHDISSSTEEDLLTILRDVEKVLQPSINVLLLCDVTTTVSALREMSEACGTRSNSSVDWCHVSRVLIVGKSDDLPVLLGSNIKVENVALLELPTGHQGHLPKTRMWTLMFHPNGRAFTDVALSSETVTHPNEMFPNVKFGYNGRQLTVVMRDNHYGFDFVVVNKRMLFGPAFRVLNLLAEAMNFSYKVIPPREDGWGKNINGSWTGVFGMLQRREADLSSDLLSIHVDRCAVSDYILPPIGETKLMILYKKEDAVDEDNLLILLRPFQRFVFSMFGVSLITCIILLTFIRLIHNKDDSSSHVTSKHKNTERNMQLEINSPTDTSAIQTTSSTVVAIYGATLKQGSTIRSSYDSDRILVATWWMFTTILSAVYCGTIMAIFAVKSEKPPFSNLAELAAREDYMIGYDSSSTIENMFKTSKQSDVMAIKQRVQDLSARDPDVFSNNVTKHLQRVWEGKYAFLAGVILTELDSAFCKLKAIDAKLNKILRALHLPKSSPFKQDFQESMSLLSESGILQRTLQEWSQSAPGDKCPEEEYPKAVSLIKIKSFFFPVGIGLICGSMVLFAEVVWHKIKQKLYQR
ncbi:probable glutamate receptor [Haliotis cracherodii]|uniref:probable glutamate receptor n=1 Tax=Haliotis cracherodii TaxID=6455 RepID=UPI0039E8B117